MLFFEVGGETDGEHPFLGVAEGDGGRGGEGDIEVNPSFGRMRIKSHRPDFVEDGVALEILPSEVGTDDPLFLSAVDGRNPARDDDAAPVGSRPFLILFVGPEIDLIHEAVGEPKPTVVRVVFGFAFDDVHREGPRDSLAAGSAQRVEIGLRDIRADEELGKWFAIDFDGDTIGCLLQFHLRKSSCREGNSEDTETEMHHRYLNTAEARMQKRYDRTMTRRTLLSTTAALAATPLAAANRLPIKKGVLVSMMPEKLTYREKLQMAKDVGFDAVEGQTLEDPAEVDALRKASEQTGMKIHSVMNMAHWNYPLSSPDSSAVERSIKGMETSLENAAAWGADTVLLVPAVVSDTVRYADAYARSVVQIKKLIPKAEKLKVKICIENVWNKFLLSPMEFSQYVDGFQTPYVAAYFDVGNILLYGYPQDWIRTLGKRIAKVHFKDFKNQSNALIKKRVPEFVDLREGDMNWKEVHKAFGEIGYQSYATVELPRGDAKYLREVSNRVDLILNGE